MKIACLTFTQCGVNIAEQIRARYAGDADLLTKHEYKSQLASIFQRYEGLVFISATGIAVRLCAPFLRDKRHDPAIVVVDDLGRYAISLVSGHLGGANDLARQIAGILRCQPVITTASDSRGIEALDLFAKHHDLRVEDWQDVTRLTGMMVDGKPLRYVSEISAVMQYPHLVETGEEGRIYVTSDTETQRDLPCCVLRPKNLHVGIGCRKGKSAQEILAAIRQVFQAHDLSLKSLRSLATVTAKQHEAGLLEAAEQLGATVTIFSNTDITPVQDRFAGSDFVQATLGISAVCEPCAYLAGGEIIVKKTVIDGITIAVAREQR